MKRSQRAPELGLGGPWAMEARAFDEVMGRVRMLGEGGDGAKSVIEAAYRFEDRAMNGAKQPPADTDEPAYDVVNGVAVIHFTGIVSKRLSFWAYLFGGSASTELTEEAIQAALADESVKSLLLVIDSPGGPIAGVAELAATVRAARDVKPITVFASDMACSAAYWIGSQGTKLLASPTAYTGAIGCYCVNTDISRMLANVGIEVTVYASGAMKGAGTRGAPLTEAQQAELQRTVDEIAAAFIADVAIGRGMSIAKVKAAADGRSYMPADAERLGLIDGVTTLRELLGSVEAEEAPQPDATVNVEAPEPDDADMDDSRASTTTPKTAAGPNHSADEVAPVVAQKEHTMSDQKPPEPTPTPSASAPDYAALLKRMEAYETKSASLESENAALKAKLDATAKEVTETKAEQGLSKLLADARGENGGPVRLAAKDSISADYLTLVYQTKGEVAARAWLETQKPIGKGSGSVMTGTAPRPATAATHGPRLAQDFVGVAPNAYNADRMPVHEAAIAQLEKTGVAKTPVVSNYYRAVVEATRRTEAA